MPHQTKALSSGESQTALVTPQMKVEDIVNEMDKSFEFYDYYCGAPVLFWVCGRNDEDITKKITDLNMDP